jgi:hypothetical protein
MDTPQPQPSASTGDVWQELIDVEPDRLLRSWFEVRRAVGIERYGVPLQRDNGRDPRRDLREELLDALAYAQQCSLPAVVGLLRGLLAADASGAFDALTAPAATGDAATTATTPSTAAVDDDDDAAKHDEPSQTIGVGIVDEKAPDTMPGVDDAATFPYEPRPLATVAAVFATLFATIAALLAFFALVYAEGC